MPFRYIEVDGKRYRITKFGSVFVEISIAQGPTYERCIANSGPRYEKVMKAAENQKEK